MSPLADLIRARGGIVTGSDRGYDQGQSPEKFEKLQNAGIILHPQDGSGVTPDIDAVIISSAVEETIPDIQAARRHNIPVRKRADLLAELFNAGRGIGIAGTSGKTTTTGMTGWMLHDLGLDPTIANGGVMPNFTGHPRSLMGNAVGGASDLIVAEMDESDGTIAFFNPAVAVLNNVTMDHKPFEVLEPLFLDFIERARNGAVVNADDERALALARQAGRDDIILFGIENDAAHINARDVRHLPGGIEFTVDGRTCTLAVPGRHNVSNALAALGVARALGLNMAAAMAALEKFRGIKRRLEVLGHVGGITLIDDFAHNPDKIAASLATLTAHAGRVIVMFQPHGFGPMKMMRADIVQAFAQGMRDGDVLFMPEIFYAGGSVTRDISSADLIGDIVQGGRDARFAPTRDDAAGQIVAMAKPGDRVVIMGARDDTLSDFGRSILGRLA